MDTKWIEIECQGDSHAVTFADESQVVGGCDNGDIRRWKIEDGHAQQQGPTMKGSGLVGSVVVSRDGRWMVSGDRGNMAIVWNMVTNEKVRELDHGRWVPGVDISSDCTKLVSVDDCNARVFNITSGIRLLPPLRYDWVTGVKFSADGSRFATSSETRGVRVYSTHNGNILFDSGQYGSTGSWSKTPLAWSSDGQQLFLSPRGKLICFDLSKLSSSEWSIHENQSPAHIASNGRFIACAAGPSVSLWDCVSHKRISSIIVHTSQINCIALSPSGRYLACGNGRNITIHSLRSVLPAKYFDRGLPLVEVSNEIFESWTQDDPAKTEVLLSKEITNASSPRYHVLANRALIRARLKHLAPAIEDAKESLQVQPSPIGYIAMAVTLLTQGDREGALWASDFAFHDCRPYDIGFLLLLKSILLFESGNREGAIDRMEHLATRANNDNDDDKTYLYTQVLAVMYMKKRDYRHAIRLIERAKDLAPKDKQCPPLVTISLIFGWSFNGLDVASQQFLCETLFTEDRAAEAVEIFLNIIRSSDEEVLRSNVNADWIANFTKKCAATLEHLGDEACGSGKHDDAITQWSAAFPNSRPSAAGPFIKWSRARAAEGLWEDALQDAKNVCMVRFLYESFLTAAVQAVKADPSNPWGHEVKHLALHGAKRYDEAIDAFKSMLQAIEQSHDPAIRQLRKNYVSPSETIAAIDPIIRETLKNYPLVVIDVNTGCLCDSAERMHIFKADLSFKELVSSMTIEMDEKRILQVVARFFKYVMFSHAWQGNEPLFQDVKQVESKSVWKLPGTPLNEKLRNFCKETRRLGYNWAWSDTCCIDKSTSSILSQSLTSMYKWYANSAATLVYLAGVTHPSKPRDLTRSLWMTRAWTLQELLAPEVIFFYDAEWKLYLGDTSANHKQSPEIMQELANAIKVPRGTIVTFSPDDLGVREKLRLASTRNATVEEDVAYSLIGIFKSDIKPYYGEGTDALGHLLEEIVARSGEVSVLAWSGKSSSYNTCLPASLAVYSQTPYSPPSLEGDEIQRCIKELREKLPRYEARTIYNKINDLSPARFATRRLHLPCIVFSVRSLENPRGDNKKLYRARVSGLGNVEFMTADDLPLHEPKKLIFANPWINYIRGPSSGVTWDDSDSDSDTGSDEVVPIPVVPALQVDNYTRALHVIARLGQPFNALLLVQQSNGTVYKRVAAENEIVVSGLGTNIASKNVRARVLEIL
ncbi:hypothetical protein F5J12DRAFT_577710 [Pisolithus orientalis]|uniref:uncharacterized protein n=1 Tax=Pisolithus orientalis TaxID=936130 RepID=UPI002223EE44|nr:uncharacterized protein F5J12DRAFT_577710 [Pisolithus orientalis]KAI5986441.1 hypothetical protein F5J12DRAFT_577710 [Pisolithus orientalis]